MSQLYTETRRVLRRGSEASPGRAEKVRQAKELALERLGKKGISQEIAETLWDGPPDEFFLLSHTPPQVAEFTELLAKHPDSSDALILVQDLPRQLEGEGATLVFVATQDDPELILLTLASLSLMGLSIHAAWISATAGGKCFATYVVLDQETGYIGRNRSRFAAITKELTGSLNESRHANQISEAVGKISARRMRRELKYFKVPVKVRFESDEELDVSSLHIECRERPGLLTLIVRALVNQNLRIKNARVSTLGERVEDAFNVTHNAGTPITDIEEQAQLAEAIREELVAAGC